MNRQKIASAIVALITAMFAVMIPIRAEAHNPPPGENRVDVEVSSPTYTIPDPNDFGYDIWVAVWSKAANNEHRSQPTAPGTVITSGEFNQNEKEQEISHVHLYGGLNPPPTDPTTPPTDPTTPPTDPTTPQTDSTSPAIVVPPPGDGPGPGSNGNSAASATLAPPLGRLAETGSSTAPIAVIASSLLIAGGLALLLARRAATS